jgi:TonB-dependent receptor
VPTRDENKYWEWLPSANLTLHPRERVNLRFAVARTMSRPEFDQLAPRNILSVPNPADPRTNPTIRGTGSAGNTQLRPQTAWNYDITAEYYPGDAAYVLSLFYKDVKDFIFYDTVFGVSLPGQGNQLFNLTQVVNLSGGKAYGFELGFNQPLSFLPSPLNGLGVQGNYTFVESEVESLLNGRRATFPGASKHNFNGTLYYQQGPFEARVAYLYRSNYLAALATGLGLNSLPTHTQGYGQLDASATYEIGNHFDVTLTATNITKQARRDYTFEPANFRGYFSRSRTVALAVRAEF